MCDSLRLIPARGQNPRAIPTKFTQADSHLLLGDGLGVRSNPVRAMAFPRLYDAHFASD